MEMRDVSMPTPRAICASSTVARTAAPIRVFSMTSQSATPITAATLIMKIRYPGRYNPPTTAVCVSLAGGMMSMLSPPDVERRLLEKKCKAHREQHLPQRVEAQGAQEHALHQQAHHGNGQRRHRNRQRPRARRPDHGQRDISAQEEVGAMREIDDPHHAENQRQAAAHQKEQRAV